MTHCLPFSTISVLGVDYTVNLRTKVRDDDGNQVWGYVDFDRCEIRLADGPVQKVVKNLCHEIVHVWQESLGMTIDDPQAEKLELVLFDLFQQETVVRFLKRRRW